MRTFLLFGWLTLSLLLLAAGPPDAALAAAPVSLSVTEKVPLTPLLHAGQAIRIAETVSQTAAAPVVPADSAHLAVSALKPCYVVYLARSVVVLADILLLRPPHKTAGLPLVCMMSERRYKSSSGGLPLRCLPLI